MDKIITFPAEVIAANREAASCPIPEEAIDPAYMAVVTFWNAFDDLKALAPEKLAALSMVDKNGAPLTLERVLDTVRTEAVWLTHRVATERAKASKLGWWGRK